MFQEWPFVVAVLILLVSGAGLYFRSAAMFLTIREHEEFKNAVTAALTRLNQGQLERMRIDDVRHELRLLCNKLQLQINLLHDRAGVLEQTRPTTGEIQATLKSNK